MCCEIQMYLIGTVSSELFLPLCGLGRSEENRACVIMKLVEEEIAPLANNNEKKTTLLCIH